MNISTSQRLEGFIPSLKGGADDASTPAPAPSPAPAPAPDPCEGVECDQPDHYCVEGTCKKAAEPPDFPTDKFSWSSPEGTGAIIGIIVGSICLILLAFFTGCKFHERRKAKSVTVA